MFGSELIYLRVQQNKIRVALGDLYREEMSKPAKSWVEAAWWGFNYGLIDGYEFEKATMDYQS